MFGKKEQPETGQDRVEAEQPETRQPESDVKVTKGGISKFVPASLVANYRANGWK